MVPALVVVMVPLIVVPEFVPPTTTGCTAMRGLIVLLQGTGRLL